MTYDPQKYGFLWRRKDRTYHFTHNIPCRIVGRTDDRIRIAALLRNGSERQHLVHPESLKHEPCHCFAECRGLERAGVVEKK